MTTIVLRHGPYDEEFNLTEDGAERSKQKGEEIRQLIGDISDAQIQIVSSTAPRAEQTAENVAEGVGISGSDIHKIEALWDDDTHPGNLKESLSFLRDLPPHLALIIITHLDFAYPVAEGLGHKGEWCRVPKLGHIVIQDKEEEINEQEDDVNIGLFCEDLNSPLSINMRIPVGDKRVISLVQTISILQGEEGQAIVFVVDGKEIVFVVPKIIPTGDPEESMTGKYDEEGYFPVQVATGGEINIRDRLKLDIPFQDLEFHPDAYVDQITGLEAFFKLQDSSILDEWEIDNVSRL